MIDAFSTPRNRIRTLILLAVCGLLAISAGVVGINDNPPGILLAYLAAIAFVLVFVHPWRTGRRFKLLIYASVLGFVVFGLLHNVFEAIAMNVGRSGLVYDLLDGTGTALFLIATLICPAAFIVGAVVLVAMFFRSHHQSTPGSKTAA